MSHTRRPVVAYTIALHEHEDDPHYGVYTDGYGLAMTIDDEWPVDTILLAPPDLVHVIMDETGATSMGTVFGGASTTGDFTEIAKSKGTHALLEPSDDFAAALAAGLTVILHCQPTDDLAKVLRGLSVNAGNLIIALQSQSPPSPQAAQELVSPHRNSLETLGCPDARIVICVDVNESTVNEYITAPDVDGVLLIEASFAAIVKIVSAIANP